MYWNRSRGFTLIEIMVTLVIISVLLTLAATSLSGDRRESLLQEEAKRLYSLMHLEKDAAMPLCSGMARNGARLLTWLHSGPGSLNLE